MCKIYMLTLEHCKCISSAVPRFTHLILFIYYLWILTYHLEIDFRKHD